MLLPEGRHVAPEELVALYDWPDDRWVRACLVMALDGALVGPDGLSGSISSPTDRAVLAAVRALADAYVVGAGTLRAEGYGPVRARAELQAVRQARAQGPAPTLVAVSASCRFDWSTARFQHSDLAPLVLTTERARGDAVADARAAGCEVVIAGRERVDLVRLRDVLADRGLGRVTIEGGPQVVRQAVAAGLLDELDLTLSPTLTASGPDSTAPTDTTMAGMRLAHVLEQDSFLFTRYVRTRER
jgi:riboflavin biosynthesis pyrimidine reductase